MDRDDEVKSSAFQWLSPSFLTVKLNSRKKEKTFWENSTGFVLFEMRKTYCKYMKAQCSRLIVSAYSGLIGWLLFANLVLSFGKKGS